MSNVKNKPHISLGKPGIRIENSIEYALINGLIKGTLAQALLAGALLCLSFSLLRHGQLWWIDLSPIPELTPVPPMAESLPSTVAGVA